MLYMTSSFITLHLPRAYDYKCLTQCCKFFPSRNCKLPPPAWSALVGTGGALPLSPPARLAAGRCGFGFCVWCLVGGQPIPARSAASWSASLQGSAGVISDGS